MNSDVRNVFSVLDNSRKIRIIFLAVLGTIGFSLRLYFFPEDVPLIGDASGYFWYANDISILGHFPEGHLSGIVRSTPPNNGWPGFLSLFFSLSDSKNFLDYINIQRLLTITISTITIIPLYFLSKKFMNYSFAIICAAAFIFAPRIIENSLLGLTEPLFVLLGITSISLFLSDKKYLVISSFGVIALFAMIRYEGLLILIPFTIIYFLRFQKNKKIILKYFLAIGIFLLIIMPMVAIRMETTGQDGLTSHIVHGPKYYANVMEDNQNENILLEFTKKGTINLLKHLAFVSIPIFFIFIPYGIFSLLRNRDYKKWTVILVGITFLIPAFYAYSRGFQDTRYLFILYPILCLMVGYTIQKINYKINKPKLVFYSYFILIISVSVIFSNIIISDFENNKELFEISKDIHKLTQSINREYEGTMFLKWSAEKLTNEFPLLHSELNDTSNKVILVSIGDNNFEKIEDYLKYAESKGLTHLVLNGDNLGVEIFRDAFKNDNNYEFLVKIYDSSELGMKNQVKIFEINYEKLKIIP